MKSSDTNRNNNVEYPVKTQLNLGLLRLVYPIYFHITLAAAYLLKEVQLEGDVFQFT